MSASRRLDELIEALQIMPGIGPVSAARIAYYLLDRKRSDALSLSDAIAHAVNEIGQCPCCHNYSDADGELCSQCASAKRRESGQICVVESPSDVEAIENSGTYHGTYFVLHGLLSPIEGIGPEELGFDALIERMSKDKVKEVILAISQTVEGEVTSQYLAALAKKLDITVSRIASGVPIGGNLNSVDGNTLALSINYRRPVES